MNKKIKKTFVVEVENERYLTALMNKLEFKEIERVVLRIHDVVGRSEQLLAYTEWLKKQGLLNATVSKLIVKKYIGQVITYNVLQIAEGGALNR